MTVRRKPENDIVALGFFIVRILCCYRFARYDVLMNIALRFVDLCLFKAGPADMPNSQGLLKISLLIYLTLGIAINLLDSDLNTSLFVSLAEVLLMIIATGLLLKFRGCSARYTQTLTALAGTGSCIAIVGFPIIWWFYQIEAEKQATSFAMLLMVGLMFWSLMVMAHIFRQSLDIKAGAAAMLTFAYTILTLLVTGLVMSGVA
ncbi:MAG: hypothetical protein GQ547_06580 [Methylophaga sp.]|nr:hypothetical protein [Methylophaga sp.]